MGSHMHAAKCPPATLEILKTLKQKFIGSELEQHKDVKVWLRETDKLVIERPEDLWKDHFKRRRDNIHCGFFSSPSEPFRCLGGPLTLDANELLHQSYTEELEGLQPREKARPTTTTDAAVDKGSSEGEKDNSELISDEVPTGTGYNLIKDLMKIEKERIVALKGGLPYMEHLKKIEKRMEDKKEKPINGMVLLSTSDFAFMFGGAAATPTDSKTSHEGMKQNTTVGEEFSLHSDVSDDLTNATNSSDSLIRVNSGVTERFERLRKDNIEFMNTIYRILTIMRNIRTVDLRSKLPLTRNQLMDLEKSRKVERDCKMSRLSRLQKRLSPDTTFSVDVFPTNITSHIENRNPSFLAPPRRRPRLLSMFGPSGPLVSLGNKPSTMVNDKFSRMMMESAMKEPRVETWEDLLNVGNSQENTEQVDLPVQVIPSNLATKAIKWSRHASKILTQQSRTDSRNQTENVRFASRNTNEESIDSKLPKPIWQVVANEKPPSKFNEANATNKSRDQQSVCLRARKNIDIVNKKVRDRCKSEIRKINRDRVAAFQHKFGTLHDIKVTGIFEKHKRRMWEAKDYGNEDPELPETRPTEWLDELTDRIHNTIGNDDPEITNSLSKLRQYSLFEVKNVPQTKAKLCLIVMSLAAYDICKISTQIAIKFIMEKIIQAPADDFYHWLSLRKLPVVILK